MSSISQIEKTALLLLESIRVDWEEDLRWSAWLGSEGERVRDNAIALLAAVRLGNLQRLIQDTNVQGYLGESWLQLHERPYELAAALQDLAVQDAA